MSLLVGLLCACQGGRCFYCGAVFSGPSINRKAKQRDDQWTKDHVWPKSAGGHAPFNLVLACRGCNRDKAARYPTSEERDRAMILHLKVNDLGRAVTGSRLWENVSHETSASGTGGFRWPKVETGVTQMGEMLAGAGI